MTASIIILVVGLALVAKPRVFLAIEGMANRLFIGDLSGLRFHGDKNRRNRLGERSTSQVLSMSFKYPQDSPYQVALTQAIGAVGVLFGISGIVYILVT